MYLALGLSKKYSFNFATNVTFDNVQAEQENYIKCKKTMLKSVKSQCQAILFITWHKLLLNCPFITRKKLQDGDNFSI